jgi:hypothetical protein
MWGGWDLASRRSRSECNKPGGFTETNPANQEKSQFFKLKK